MFAGKSSRLLWHLKRAQIAGKSVILFKPSLDNRYSEAEVVTHDNDRLPSISVTDVWDIYHKGKDYKVVGIDEIQFMDAAVLIEVAEKLADEGAEVITAGLDLDAQDKAFEGTKELMGIAEYVEKLFAVCPDCNREIATRSYRKSGSTARFEVGGKDAYEPLCRYCNNKRKGKIKAQKLFNE